MYNAIAAAAAEVVALVDGVKAGDADDHRVRVLGRAAPVLEEVEEVPAAGCTG
jgi:hypothetical protein